ncbi:MAG: 6,7-dimethyl-8-ribityllumazine synthase [Alphaproteobacteria bacterium]
MPHFMIVTSPYYEEISTYLLEGVTAFLSEKRATYEVFEVPGALEIPLTIKLGIMREESRGTSTRNFDGFIALGCVIRGETSHYDIVCGESARGLSQLSLDYNVPIGNGILTCDTKDQAIKRADPKQKNKGRDAASAAYELYEIKRDFKIID